MLTQNGETLMLEVNPNGGDRCAVVLWRRATDETLAADELNLKSASERETLVGRLPVDAQGEARTLLMQAAVAVGRSAGSNGARVPFPEDEDDSSEGWAALPEWPQLPAAALHGLAGEIVGIVAPYSEADPAALLSQFLVGAGNCIGRGPSFRVEGTLHHANLFALLIGPTASGRKGTALDRARQFLGSADAEWNRDHITHGLSSGEGLIAAVRDAVTRMEPTREAGRVTGSQVVVVDAGVTDKRLLVVESEFSGPLRVMSRDGNLLSAKIREAWDNGMLGTMTKNSPLRASGAHISIIGHITAEELRRYLDRTSLANGFANRFLMFCVRRAQCLPEGGTIPAADLIPALEAVRLTVARARQIEEMTRDDDARERWAEVYPVLSGARPGLLGAVTGRAEAQVLRLSMVYALLDQSPIIRVPHLDAALALWRFAEESARYVFGDSLGDPLADALLAAIRATPEGMTRAEMYDYFGRNKSREAITAALRALAERGLVECVREETGGRPTERWLTRKTRYTRKGQAPSGLNAFNAFNAYPPSSQEPLPERPEGEPEVDESEGGA